MKMTAAFAKRFNTCAGLRAHEPSRPGRRPLRRLLAVGSAGLIAASALAAIPSAATAAVVSRVAATAKTWPVMPSPSATLPQRALPGVSCHPARACTATAGSMPERDRASRVTEHNASGGGARANASAPPSNDNFSNAVAISSLPFNAIADNTAATTEPGEPGGCSSPPEQQTVWYSFTPASTTGLTIDTFGSAFSAMFNVYEQTGAGFGGLSQVACEDVQAVNVKASANTTYYIQVGNVFGSGGTLQLNVKLVPPPVNDNFANATQIAALPFSDSADTTGATIEPGEPNACISPPLQGSAWYAFTPTASESVSASIDTSRSGAEAVYSGTSLGNLTFLQCAGNEVSTIHVTAGTTYYFQVGSQFGEDGPLTFRLAVTPPPTADFGISPADPSIFDRVVFFDASSDPGDLGIQNEAWNFGDGTTGSGNDPAHQYAADGDYTTTLTITTPDGRTASTSNVIHVRTHDVAITALTVPASARADQTRTITVGVSDKRYPETVVVQLLKGNTQSGFDVVGTLTQSIPVKAGKHTTPFAFSYTFTPTDATIGKVTFEAVATIQDARDALPADNTAIASTIVR